MPNSVITPKMEYNETTWVVSHVNLGGLIPGHSAIIIEGVLSPALHTSFLSTGSRRPGVYIAQTDITALVLGKQSSLSESSVSSITNQTGVIREVRLFQYTERDYSACSGVSHYVNSQRVINLIESIEREKSVVAEFWQRFDMGDQPSVDQINAFIKANPYQTYGNHLFFGKTSKGINCTEWCNIKLKELGIAPGLLEDNMPKPKISSGQCIIL